MISVEEKIIATFRCQKLPFVISEGLVVDLAQERWVWGIIHCDSFTPT